jgi:hypothetical protein
MKTLLLFLLSTTLGSASPHSAFAGTVSLKYARKNHTVNVCWMTRPTLAEYVKNDSSLFSSLDGYMRTREFPQSKKLIQKTITDNYQLSTVGIQFEGWQECPTQPDLLANMDLVAFVTVGGIQNSFTSIGTLDPLATKAYADLFSDRLAKLSTRHQLPSFVLIAACDSCRTTILSVDAQLQFTALHEFGHAAGLLHEDDRIDPATGTDVSAREVEGDKIHGNLMTSKYDRQSIMSYHYLNNIMERIGEWAMLTPNEYWVSSLPPSPSRTGSMGAFLMPFDQDSDWEDGSVIESVGKNRFHILPKLSAGDEHALQCLYTLSAAERALTCDYTYDPLE